VDNVLRHGRLRRRTAALTAMLAVGLLAASMSPARAEDPTPTAKALTLSTPGVVYLEVAADVSIRLGRDFLDLPGRPVSGRRVRFSTGPLQSGTATVVTPEWSVTASHVVEFDDDQQEIIKTYAANRLFFGQLKELFGEVQPSGDELFEEQHLSDRNRELWLRACYDEQICKFDVKPDVTLVVPVQVGGEARSKDLPAKVRANTHFDGGDIAALQVIDADADPMPTVPLATSAGELQGGQGIIAMGFPGSHTKILPKGTTQPSSSFGNVSNVTSDGSSQVIQVDMNVESGMSGGPGLDEDGKVIGIISYTGVDENGDRTQVYLQTADNIRSVLREVGVQPTRGELDTAFAEAMEYYWAGHYTAALPQFQKVLDLQEGHLLAKKYLRLAQAKAGGPDDLPLTTSSTATDGGRSLTFWALVAAGVLIVIALVVLALVWRRRRRPAPDRDRASMPVPTNGVDDDAPVLHPPVAGTVGLTRAMDGSDAPANSQPSLRREAVMVEDQEAPTRGFCPYCGTRQAPGARFCSGCGQAQ
jgi:membrane protein implicated in regulation of membrane protease activity